jgi:hypothetical protein
MRTQWLLRRFRDKSNGRIRSVFFFHLSCFVVSPSVIDSYSLLISFRKLPHPQIPCSLSHFFLKQQGACFFFTWLPSPTTENPDHNTTPHQQLLASINLRFLLRTMQTREFPAFKLLDSGVKSIWLQVHKLLKHMEKKTTTTTHPKQELPGANEKREKKTTTTTTTTTTDKKNSFPQNDFEPEQSLDTLANTRRRKKTTQQSKRMFNRFSIFLLNEFLTESSEKQELSAAET